MTNFFRFASILLILSTFSGHLAWVRSEKIVRENECAAYCSENQQHNTFKYEPGKSYIYKYETHVKTLIVGNSDEHASTKLDTTVIISVLTPCEFSLQLKNSTLIVDSAIAGPYGAQLDARPLRFWFNQGRVDRLCPGFDSDPTFILNVKRGILSAFQTTSIRPDSLHYETDISGLCRTRSQSSPPDPETGLRVSKVKNLRHCGGRSSGLPVHGSQRSGVFDLNAAIRSEQSCVQDFTPSSRILSSAQCEETHVLKPFSQGMQGASILVKQRLTHLVTRNSDELDLSYDDDQISGIFTTLVYATPSTSLLDTSTESSATHEDDSMLRQLLPQFAVLSKSLRVGVGDSIPDAYLEFLTSLRSVSASVMDKLLFTTEGLDRTLLLTLIAQAGTEESLDFLIQQHDYHAISDAEMNRLLPEIQTYQTPSVFSVEKLHELSKSDGVRVAALLPLGSLIYRYCSTVDCQEDETVRSIMRALDYSLPPFCRTYTNKDTLVTSATLKAIGNAGIYTSNLKSCMFEPIGHLEVRLNAIRSLRKVPCSDVHNSNALGLFLNTEENIELRLQAYLVSIKCATPALLDRLSNHLLEEPVHQVSSFVLSHLTTLQQSTSSSRHSIRLRQLLQNKLLRSRYSTDKPESAGSNPFKYSAHYGHAFDLPKLSTNGSEAFSINKRDQVTVEADIVYAKSYLPTSLYLNLSLNLFEEEVQLFEFGTRMEGFEGRLETLFGKGGYFPDESVMKLLKSFQSTHAASNLDSRLDPIRAEVTRTPEPRLDLDREEGREYASYFVRVGGEDVRFAHAHEGLAGVMGAFGAQRDKNTNTTNIHSHQVYLNNTASISSISGLPLEFALSLVNSYNFNYNYELDWSDLFRGKNLRLDVHFNPSLHLQFKSFLGVRLEYVERKEAVENEGDKEFDDGVEEVVNKIQNGLELRAKVLTESFMDLKFALQKGSIVDFKINVPRKRVELLDISTRLLLHKVSSTQPAASDPAANSAPVASLTSGTIPYPSRPIGQESYEICWPEAVSDTLGLEFCSELNYYNYSSDARLAGFPLSGDFNLRARVYRVDTFSRYELFASNGFSVTNTKSLQSLVLSFNTPGSAIDRKIHASLSLDRANPGLKLRLQCPLGNVELAGKYMAKPNHRAVTLLAHMNGREMLNLEANMMSETSGNTARYEPSLVVFYKSVLFVDIKGHIDYIVGVKYNADLSVKGFTQRPIDISGDLTYASNKTSLNVHMNSDQYGFFELRGTLKQSDHGSFLAKALVNYGSSKSIQIERAHFSLRFDQYEKASLYKSNTHFKLESTQYESINLDLKHALQSTDHLFDSSLDLTIFGHPWTSRQIYRNIQRGRQRKRGSTEARRSFELLASLRCDDKNLHYKVQALHEAISSNTTSQLLAQLNDRQQLLASYSLTDNQHGGQQVTLQGVTPWTMARLQAEYMLYDEHTVDATVQLEWARVNISQYQLYGRINYVYDPKTLISKLSTNVILGDQLNVNSASLVSDNLNYQLDAQWTLNSITFNIYLPNNRHLSGHLVYTSSDTRSDDWRKELTVSLKLNKDDAVELSVLYSRDLRTREELIVTKLAWKHANMNANGHKMAALENKMADGWKRVEWNVSYKLFEKINMELVLPQYYFHVTLDLNYVGFYDENSLRSELSWGTTREIVSQIQIQSQFQLNWTRSYFNLTVLTPFKSYEELSLDTKFSLSNRTEDVELNLQAVGRLPSHEAHLVSRLRYNLHSNRYAASLSANNTLFAISTVDFIFDNTGNTGPSDNSASNDRAQSDNTGSHDDQTPFGNTASHDDKRQSGSTAFDKTPSDNTAPYSTRVYFSCGPGQADLALVRIDYTILAERHSGNIDFFTPFAGLQFVSSEFGFHRSLSEFFAKVTPFGVKSSNEGKIFTNEAKFGTNEAKIGTNEGRPSQNELKTPQFDAKLPKGAKRSPYEPNQPKPNQFISKGDYIVSYSFGNSESPSGFSESHSGVSESHSGVSESHSGVSGTRDSRFDLTVTTPLKPLNRFNILYTVARSSEYKLNFTLNEDVSFAHVNLTGVNKLPFGARVRVDIARIVSDLRVHLDVRSDALNVYAGANGGDLLDLRVESANAYTLQLKFAGNEIHSELELGENSLNYEGKWNNYTLSGSSEYSITYKELWFDCLIKANVRSNAFRTAYDLYIAHDTDSDVINHNIFRTELRVNDVQATHRLEIQMDSALHNKWVNIITVNNNTIVNEYHQVISPNHTDYSYLMTVHLNSTDSLFHLNYSLDTSQIGFTLVDSGFTSVDPDLTSVDSDATSVDSDVTSVDNQSSKGFTSVLFGLHSVDFLFSIPELDPFRLTYAIDPAYNAKFALEVRKDKFARVNLSNRDGKHFDLAVNTTYFPPIAAGVDLVPGGAEISFRRGSDVYACSLAYAVPRLATADVRVAVTKNGREDGSFRVSYDFSRVNYTFDAGLRYNFSAVYSNSVSVRYETVYLTKYEMVVTTDFELLRELSVNLDLDLKNPQQRQLKLGIILNKEKFLNFGTNLAKTSNKINLSAGLESNLIGSERNNYTLDIGVENLNTHDYLIDLKYIYNDKEVQVNSKVIYNTNAILIEVLLKTPIDNYELVFLKFNIKWTSMNNYSLIFRLQKNTVVTHLNSSIQINHEHSHYTGFIYLTSPHQVFNNVHTDFALSFHNGFNFNVSLQNTNRTIQFICTNVSNSTVLTIFTPYTGFENITLSSLITTQRSHLLIFKNTAQWVKLSFEKRTVKDILFVMELPSYVFINKIDLNIDLAGNISVNMNVVKFDSSREYFAMEFTGGEFKCTIHLPSLNIHHFNAHVKFSVNSARTNVRIFVRIINDATPILYLKINYDESKNFYLNLYKPMTNTSYVSIAGSYRNSEANTGIEDPSVSRTKAYPGNEYQLAIDLTQIDSRFKYNIVLGNNTVQIHDRNRLLYVISYAYNPSGVNLEIVKDSVPDPFLTFALRFDPTSLYAVDINVNNTDNFFKYAKLRVHYDNSTSRGQFQLEYLNKVKSWLEFTKQPDGLIHLDTKLILNFDSLINVKTRITLNKTEIIPHVLDFDYNYVIRDNYVEFSANYEKLKLARSELSLSYKVNNKEYSFTLGNSSLVIQSDILNLDIFLTRTISSINFDFESFSINFDHNLESSERFVRFNLTNVNSRNVYVAVDADGGSADGGLADGRVTLEVAYAKHRARVGLSDLVPEEVQYENADNHLSLNLTLRPDTLLVFYNLTGSPEVKDWLTLNTPVLRLLPDDFLIEFHPRENLFGGRSQSHNQKDSDVRRQNEQSPNQRESGARRQSQGYQNEFGKGPNQESVKSGAAKNSNDGIKNTNAGTQNSNDGIKNTNVRDHNARNAIIIDLKNAFFKASLNGSSLQYASHHLTLDGPLLSGHANVATAYPVHLIGNAIGHTASFHRDVDLITADLSNAKGTIFRLHRTANAFDFAHTLGDGTVRLTSRPGSVRFGVDDLTGVRVNASIVYESNAFVNATLLVPKLDLDATVCHRFAIVNERIDWTLALILNKGALNKDSLSKDSLSKDYLSKASLNKDFFNNKALNNYFSSKDSLNKDFLNKDSLNKDFLSKDSLNKDFLSKDSLNKNSLSKDSLKEEVYSIEYSGNLSNNKLIITLPDFHLGATNALLSEFDARVNFSANAFGLKLNNARSATQRMELFAFANADSVDFAYENKEDALTVRTVLSMNNSSSEVILSSAKSKNINFKVTGRNLTFLKDISSFDMTLDCVCSNQVNANVSIDYVTKGTAGNIQIRLIGGENKIDFNLNSNAKNNAVKNITLGFEFDENSLKGEARYDERFILLEGKLNSGQAVLSLKSSEFNPLQAVGTVEKVAETDKVRTAGFKVNLIGNRFVDSIVVKYNAPTQERLMTLNAIGFLRKDQVVSADFTYDLRAHVKHKIVYLNVKYKNKQVVLLENKFSTNEYILNYKIASNVLLNRLHLDYKFLVHANINELRSGSKMKIVIELPELVHLNKTLYVKYNPQGRQYVLQLGDEIDITANASEAKVKLNVFRLNSIAVSRYGPDHVHFDLKNLENPSIPGYNVSDFQAFLNYAKNATGVTAELKIAGHYNAPFTVSASVHLNGSDLIVSGRINEAPFDLTLTNSPGELVVHLNTELFTINLENGFNGEIRANYSLTFLNERHKFALRLTATEFAYEFNDFTIHTTLVGGYQLTHAYKENRIYAFANASKKALQIVYFRSKAEMSFDGDFKLLLADNDGGRLDVEYIRSSENNFDAYLLLNIPPERHNSINIQINKTFTDLKLAFDLVDAHVASFSLTNGVERGSREVNFEYARRHSSDDFTCVAHFTTNRTGVALGTFIRAKNVSTRILNVNVDRDIKRVDLNVYDTLLVNYDFVSNFTFNGIVASKDLNASFNVDFTKNNIYLNVNLLSYSYEFEYEIVQHKVLLKYRRFYQSTLMQHIHLDYHYVRDFYKLKLLIYSLFGVNLEMDANLSLNAKNINGAVRYQFNKIDNSLVFKVDKTELTKNVEIIAQLPILKLRNYKINFGIDQETLLLVVNEISNKQGTYFYFHVLNSRSHKRLSFKTPVQLNRNIFVMANLELDLDERAVTLNSSYSQDTLILLGFNTTNRISDADLSSYLSVITPYAPYDRVVVKLNVPLTKNIHTIFYSLNLGRDTYEISYNKLTPDKRHSYAIYANTLVWDFHLHDNNVALHLNMLNNSINITSAHLQNFNMSLTNAHKNLTILSNLTIAMTDLSNDPSNGQAFSNAFSFNVHYEKEASQLDYNFKFVLENELNQNKRLLLNIIYPNNTILFNFDFQYSSIYKNAFTIYTNIFKPISLHIRNNFTSRKDLSTHCEAKYSNHHLFVNFEHKLNQNGFDVNSNVNITINNRTLCLDVLNKFVSRNNLDIKVSMATPLEKLTNAVFYFKINTTAMASSPNYFGGVLLNSRDIMSLALYTSEDRAYWICVNNDYLPVKLTYLYDVSNLHDISLFAYITWNQIQQYGFKFALHNEFSDDRFLTVELFVPMHKVELNLKANRRSKLYYVVLVKVGDLNYGFDILVQSDTQLNVYLNYNIIKLTLVNSYDKLDVNTYIKHGLLIHIVNNLLGSDKHIHLLVHNHYNDAMSKLTITLDHFKLPHAVELQVYNSATTSRLEFSYSSDYAEKFTVEIYSELIGSKLISKYLLQHKPSHLLYIFNSELNEYDLNSNFNLQYRNTHNVLNNIGVAFNFHSKEKEISVHGNKNSLNLGYDNASVWLRLNEKPPIQFTYHGLSHLKLSYGALAYTALSHLSARELTVSISESLNGVAFVDFSTVLKLNHTKLLYGKLLYSGRILENLQRHYIHQYNDVNVASTRVLDAFYDLTQTDAVSTLYAVYGSVVGRADEVVNATFEVMKQIVGDCASQNDLVFKLSLPSWNDQQTSILVDTYQTLSAILNQYLRNIFRVFMFDISSVMTFTDDLKNLIEISKHNIHSLYSHVDSLKTRIKHNTRSILTSIRLKLLELQDLTIQWLREGEEQALLAAQSLLATVQSKAITLMQYIYDVKDTVQTFAMSVYDLATDFVSMFVEIEEVRFLMGYIVDTYREYFNFQKLHEFISALCQLVVDDIQRNFSELSAYILSLCENKYVHSIRNFFAIVYHKICWGWSYFHVTSRLENELYNRLESYIYLLIFSTSERSISQYGFSLEDRYIEFAQSLPVEWDGFNRLPHYEQLLGKLEKLANSDGTGLMTEVENFKYTLYEQFNTGGLVEDKTLALIVLDQVITYDGLLSPLPNAPGLYVLSYEMRDEKFVLLLEYNQKGEKLIHFWTGGDKLVLNMASGDILLNDQHVELPYELSFNAYIVRIDSSRVKISYEDHLSVLCHMRRDICVIEISPWLHGKTQGLLGNFDHESYNDQAFPNSTLTTNSQSFQQSWTIASPHQSRKSSTEDQEEDHKLKNSSGKASLGDQKAPKVHTQTSFELDWTDEKDPTVQDSLLKSNGSLTLQSLLAKFKTEGEILSGLGGPTFSKSGVQGPTFSKSGSGGPTFSKSESEGPTFGEKSSSMSYDKVDQCEAYFLRSRAPSLCWHRLDSRVFYALCVRSGDPCRAIDAFIAMCREIDAEVKLEPPSHCVQCSINNHHLSQGKSVTLHHSGNSTQHDIVFLVNSYDDLCLSQINMGDILNQLYEHKHPNQSQGKHTPPDLRFGFVLFNNNKYNSDIQMYTSDQNIWHTGVQQGADTLKRMLSDKCTYSSCADVTTTFQALKFLTTLSYRPGATRSIVLLQCSACTDTKGYSDTLAMLLEYNLQLHILSPHGIQSMPSPIIGLDSTGLSYVHKNGQTYTELNKELPASSRLHKDLCSSLALKSHGSLFSLSSPSRETVWPRLILKAAHTRVCEVCDCVAGDDLMGRLQCDPCATGVDYVDEYEEDLGKVPMDYLDPNEPLDIIM